MKYSAYLLLIICINFSASAQTKIIYSTDSIQDNKYLVGFIPSSNSRINGISILYWNSSYSNITNGALIDLNPLTTLLSVYAIPWSVLAWMSHPFRKNEDLLVVSKSDTILISNQTNGISFSLGILAIDKYEINGLSASLFFNSCTISNGLSFSLYINNTDNFSGIMTSPINKAKSGKGVMIGLFNSTNNYKGVQFGLWNIINGRGFPLINFSI